MKRDINKEFLDSFFGMLNEFIISYGHFNGIVLGIVTGIGVDIEELWQHQNFIWRGSKNEQELSDLIILCEFLIGKKLIDGDKILIPEDEFLERISELGWDNDKSLKVIDDLLSIEIKMVNEGEETDSFFVHF